MSVAAILARAKAAVAAEDFAPGTYVEVEVAGVVTRGRVAFVDEGWVHWVEDDGAAHATPIKHIRRSQR